MVTTEAVAMAGIMTMTIITAHVMTMVMAGGIAVESPAIVATARLPEATKVEVLVVSRGRSTAPIARRQTAVACDSANNAAPRWCRSSVPNAELPWRVAASFAASAARRANQSEFSTAKTFVKGSLRGEKTCLGLRLLPHV